MLTKHSEKKVSSHQSPNQRESCNAHRMASQLKNPILPSTKVSILRRINTENKEFIGMRTGKTDTQKRQHNHEQSRKLIDLSEKTERSIGEQSTTQNMSRK